MGGELLVNGNMGGEMSVDWEKTAEGEMSEVGK